MSRFDFTRHLQPQEAALLAEPTRWRWIGVPGEPLPPSVHHPEHEAWMANRSNLHAPGHREIMLTFRGRAVHTLDEAIYWREPGTVMLFEAHTSRDLKGAAHKHSFHCLWLHFQSRERLAFNSNSCDEAGRYFQEIPPQIRSDREVALVTDAWDQCQKAPDDPLCRTFFKSRITALLLEILGTPTPQAPESQHQQVIASIEVYMREHLGEALTLHALARIAGYSPFFFHRLFVRHTGKTPVAYLNLLRLERAKERLCEGYTVAATAESVGFSSLSYFNHFFRSHTGVSPGKWGG